MSKNLENKLLDFCIFLNTSILNLDILCFSEHWLTNDHVRAINIERYKLVSNFSRGDSKHRRTCMYVHENVKTSKVNYLKDLSCVNDFEMSVTELVDFKVVVVCIYRTPYSAFNKFLCNLDLVIEKVHQKEEN
jgi:hypothetical protein